MNLNTQKLKDRLNGDDIFINFVPITESTNDDAKIAVRNKLTHEGIFIAGKQTSGRGRRGKSFYSQDDGGLYFTMVFFPKVGLTDCTLITSAAAVAVCEAIKEATKKDPKIKWVNDIFIDGKKVCGILTEAVVNQESGELIAVVVGVGINVATNSFPEEIKDIAGALGEDIDGENLVADIFNRLKKHVYAMPSVEFMKEYRKNSLVLGNKISFIRNGENLSAFVNEITDRGELIVITEAGEKLLLNSGEISIKL